MDTICQSRSPDPTLSQYHTVVLKDALLYGKSHMCIFFYISDFICLFLFFLSFAKSIFAPKANFYSS